MSDAPLLYLAGPDVFEPDAATRFHDMKAICARHGFVGLSPLDSDTAPGPGRDRALAIFDSNLAMIRSCDAVIANLTPFRGPSADVGTALEVGIACALGKAVFGFSHSAELYTDKVPRHPESVDDDPRCLAGYSIENFGLFDNLMVIGAVERSGGVLLLGEEPFASLGFGTGLELFERCVKEAATAHGVQPLGGTRLVENVVRLPR